LAAVLQREGAGGECVGRGSLSESIFGDYGRGWLDWLDLVAIIGFWFSPVRSGLWIGCGGLTDDKGLHPYRSTDIWGDVLAGLALRGWTEVTDLDFDWTGWLGPYLFIPPWI